MVHGTDDDRKVGGAALEAAPTATSGPGSQSGPGATVYQTTQPALDDDSDSEEDFYDGQVDPAATEKAKAAHVEVARLQAELSKAQADAAEKVKAAKITQQGDAEIAAKQFAAKIKAERNAAAAEAAKEEKGFWAHLRDSFLLKVFAPVLDQASFLVTPDGDIISPEQAYHYRGGRFKLYGALSAAEKDRLLHKHREILLAGIKEQVAEQKRNWKYIALIYPFTLLVTGLVATGSGLVAAFYAREFAMYLGMGEGLADMVMVSPVFAVVFLINAYIFSGPALDFFRQMFAYDGLGKGFKYQGGEPKIYLDKDAKVRSTAAKANELTGSQEKWYYFFMTCSGMFSLTLAALTRVSSEGVLEVWLSGGAATGLAMAIAAGSFFAMWALTSSAIRNLVTMKSWWTGFWQLMGNLAGVEPRGVAQINGYNDFRRQFRISGSGLALTLSLAFIALCFYGLIMQSWAQSGNFVDVIQDRTGWGGSIKGFSLPFWTSMTLGIFGKGAFIGKAASNTVQLVRNLWRRMFPITPLDSEKSLLSANTTTTAPNIVYRAVFLFLAFCSALTQAFAPLNVKLDFVSDDDCPDDPSTQPTDPPPINDPSDVPGADDWAEAGSIILAGAALSSNSIGVRTKAASAEEKENAAWYEDCKSGKTDKTALFAYNSNNGAYDIPMDNLNRDVPAPCYVERRDTPTPIA